VKLKRPIARSVQANRGLEARYAHQILALVEEMTADVEEQTRARYKSHPPVLALDTNPVNAAKKELRALSKRWQTRFDEQAPKIAGAYLKAQFKASDRAFAQSLKDSGWAVKFQMTPAVKEAFTAKLAENVSLIKSISEKYLQQVEGAVMRSYSAGRDLQHLTNSIQRISKQPKKRAAFIALDQSNKANAVVVSARQVELGIKQAVWMHSSAGKTPRPTHVAMNGKRYDVAVGMYDPAVKRWIFPGEEPGCRCTSRSIFPFALPS